MELSEISEIISLSVGIIGSTIAVYQCAILRENKKRKNEIQHILAGINHTALQKQMSWQNQMNTLAKLETTQDLEYLRTLLRAKDDFQEIVGLTPALEGTIDTENSAIIKLMEKSIKITKLNNELQAEGLKNPTMPAADISKSMQPTAHASID